METIMKESGAETHLDRVRLRRREDQVLLAEVGADKLGVPVTVARCLPWLAADQFISLRDKDGNEIALVRDLSELDTDSRAVLEKELEFVKFCLRVTKLDQLKQDFELRRWEVQTHAGPRVFQTLLDDWPEKMSDGSFLIRDICGDFYQIVPMHELDTKSQEYLWSFSD
ncbi:MAG: DUF1854 domain-containing protein [Verrucomicrobiota bacterium]